MNPALFNLIQQHYTPDTVEARILSEKYDSIISSLQSQILVVWCFAIAFAALAGVLIWVNVRMRRQRAALTAERDAVIIAKDANLKCIEGFLGLNAKTLETVADYHKIMHRKMSASQYDSVMALLKSRQLIKDCTRIFETDFDENIMRLFPGFVDDVNKSVKDGQQYSITSEGELSPELRIIALTRLGITEPLRIAHILGLSVNTVYAYKSRIKSRMATD